MALTDNIIVYWKFNETSGTNANDEVSNYDLTLSNDAIINSGGKLGYGHYYSSGYYSTNATFLDGGLTTRSCSLRFKTSATGVFTALLGKSKNFGEEWITIAVQNDNKLYLRIRGGLSAINNIRTTTDTVNDGNWHHIVCMGSNSGRNSIKVYLDGTENGSLTTSGGNDSGEIYADSSLNLNIGRRGTNDRAFTGYIDELGFWNRLLTTDEVTELHNDGDGISYPFTATSPTNASFLYNMV